MKGVVLLPEKLEHPRQFQMGIRRVHSDLGNLRALPNCLSRRNPELLLGKGSSAAICNFLPLFLAFQTKAIVLWD